ncbi:Eco57I restriction-modification methylase domain-containing protein [Flavobacterium magnum]|uniref:Eco57I restriction-modification methylase domain-containing protein n=1 Tax=Flavobacterium magnum TaxID=2162713 RepID=UPI0015E68D4E|nr:N-6 DNA methylase [Flavobacterium magnum]
MAFFQNSVIKKYLQNQNKSKVASQWNIFRNHFLNTRIQNNIRNSKEEEYQGEFLIDLFVNVLGYTKKPQENYNLVTEKKNVNNSEKSDGAIIINDKVKAVIELKGTKLTDLKKIEVQAFGYKNNHPHCVFVITSNFEKLRFYINNATEYLEFNLFQLTESEFELLYLVLSYESLSKGLANTIKEESIIEEKKISNELYKDYSTFKSALHQNLVLLNPEYNPLELLKKSQKLLDRFLFIFFAEDKNLVPTNLIFRINKEWEQLVNMRINQSLYDRYKIYFEDLNSGALVTLPAFSKTVSDTKEKHQLFAYNGGLFQPDEVLNNIRIDDALLFKYTEKLSEYDFESEIDVNILGHIFENSLNDFDEVKAKIEGKKIDTSKTKRKKDGVFYTPKYITKYMVDNSLGLLCNEKKKLLKINDENYQPAAKRSRERLNNLNEYRKWLKQLAICDPACGSGAFLNQAFDFLIEEHKYIDELSAKYNRDTFILSDVEKSILENNLFGVDLNDESVEIAKLSLWLRTAKPNRKLNDLNNNIKCGNSLIDDKVVAGDKAFDWYREFPKVFAKGGFDVIIGNPPYGIFIDKEMQDYFKAKFPLTQYKTNLYVLFVERMLQVFEKGIVFFIIPKSLLFNSYYELIRKELILKTELNEIFTITERVFEDAEVGSSLLIKFTIKDDLNKKNIVRLASAEKIKNFISGNGIVENKIEQNSFLKIPKAEISVISSDSQSIVKKLNQMKTIDSYYTLKNGLNPGNIKHLLVSDEKTTNHHRPIIWGKDISKYSISW